MEVSRVSILEFSCIFDRMKTLIFFVFIFTSCFLAAQETLASDQPATRFDSLTRNEWKKIGDGDTIVSSYQLDSVQQQEWKKFDDYMHSWMYKIFLKKYKINISCAGCTGVYMDFIFAVDESGTATMRKIKGGRICTDEFSDNQKKELFLELSKYKFAVFFKGKICYYRFGAVLKC
jgi:hypothetical protein